MADIAAELEEGGMARTLKDLFAGAAGGIAQVLLGESIVPAYASGASVQSSFFNSRLLQFYITCSP